MTSEPRYLSPPEFAKRFKCSAEKVIRMIRKGQLQAINVAEKRDGKKPRFLISEEAVKTFEACRAWQAAPPRTRRKKAITRGVIEFF
jgi:hypothetical protein